MIDGDVWMAEMDTEHFHFQAFGETEKIAEEMLLNGFCGHLVQCFEGDLQAVEDHFEGYFDGPCTVETLREWYGINTLRAVPGFVYRDGEQMAHEEVLA
jgi:hypothetical protein